MNNSITISKEIVQITETKVIQVCKESKVTVILHIALQYALHTVKPAPSALF